MPPREPKAVSKPLVGYSPTDVFSMLAGEEPRSALFTTFTFSPGTFHHEYLTPLVHHGCGDVTVLADSIGYAQSLFGAAAAEGIGTDYRLRQVNVTGAFHAKLVILRTALSAVVGVGSGNLTAPGLKTNAEVGSLYRVDRPGALSTVDNLVLRLRALGLMGGRPGETTGPVPLSDDARLLSNLDEPIIDQLELPPTVTRVEIVSPFVDGQQEVLAWLQARWPSAEIRLRIDPKFGSLTKALISSGSQGIHVLVPAEPSDAKKPAARPAVHGKLICFVGDEWATVVLGSANLSRPALLTCENFEAVVERRLPTAVLSQLLVVPGIRWRKARPNDGEAFSPPPAPPWALPLVAELTAQRLLVTWGPGPGDSGVLRVISRGRTVCEQRFQSALTADGGHRLEIVADTALKAAARSPCVAEVELEAGRTYRGWIEVTDLLGLAPLAKSQLGYAHAIASDPLGCKEWEVVQFIGLLRRSLAGARLHSFGGNDTQARERRAADDDETPVDRLSLLEDGPFAPPSQSLLMSRLVTRSLDRALTDLQFFARDTWGRSAAKQGRAGAGGRLTPPADALPEQTLPPTVDEVLIQLFDQLAGSFDAAGSGREVALLLGQIPVCLKALAYATGRWLSHVPQAEAVRRYFHRVVVSCLAPGRNSQLCHTGAVRRVGTAGRAEITGSPDFSPGVAALEAYLLQDYRTNPWGDGSAMRDMLDVVRELGCVPSSELADAAHDMGLSGGFAEAPSPAVYEQLRADAERVTGALASLLARRQALEVLVALVNSGNRTAAAVRPAAREAAGEAGTEYLARLAQDSAGRVTLLEIAHGKSACPKCRSSFPLAAVERLKDPSKVHRCVCGVWLVRSLDP